MATRGRGRGGGYGNFRGGGYHGSRTNHTTSSTTTTASRESEGFDEDVSFGFGRFDKRGGPVNASRGAVYGPALPRNEPADDGDDEAPERIDFGNDEHDKDKRFEDIDHEDNIDLKFGFVRFEDGADRLGWLVNMKSTLVRDKEWPTGLAGVDYYFLQEDGSRFKVTRTYEPYFIIGVKDNYEAEVEQYLRRKFENVLLRVVHKPKVDLDLPNHLLGNTKMYLQLLFRNVGDLLKVRRYIIPLVKRNIERRNAVDAYADLQQNGASSKGRFQDVMENVVDIREYDVPYCLRVAIDLNIRVGYWYLVSIVNGKINMQTEYDRIERFDPVVLAFDIECTKQPLKFPDAKTDMIMMISYMIDKQGYLITNRDIVSKDIENFEYTPKPEYEGPFIVFNEVNELALLHRFFEHIREVKPSVFSTFNGDSFDWPFVETRAAIHGLDMFEEIGFRKDVNNEYKSRNAVHMDCFRWVKRDSYLPAGSHGLKAVTTSKLGYNPLELDPEDMTRLAGEDPQTLASYSVSDAVATYYLYMKYVHPFVFSLCNIIPFDPDEVLRKGSGTLCETLLMVEAFTANVIMPNKQTENFNKTFEGHLLQNETYVGGHVEALEAGVFRSDIPSKFRLDPSGYQELLDKLDDILKFFITVESKLDMTAVTNYDEVRSGIASKLAELRDNPNRTDCPIIYHLDVGAMYPNIMLTNRLQPTALVDDATCATCDFNVPEATCQRKMKWAWRGEYFPAQRNEYDQIRNQIETEKFMKNGELKPFHELAPSEQSMYLQKRLGDYSRKVYKRSTIKKEQERESIVCQRENSFYLDVVKEFRDRRYVYKEKNKNAKRDLELATQKGDLLEVDKHKKSVVLWDSLQLAHKCILNSFYGYMMRRGARWYSMETAGIVCYTGATIITIARKLVERLGRPLELDTDGIWCILPAAFPEKFQFKLDPELTAGKKSLTIDFPGVMLNHLVHINFTNHQFEELVSPLEHTYVKKSVNEIFFEVDGPYRAMILPASKEEDKRLKKRYAVFNADGSIAELKGFEVKRRGELKLIKIFQTQIFERFLEGQSLDECYQAVAQVANRWLDVLYSKGCDMEDDEVIELLSENRSMSRKLDDYGSQKSTSISTAKRLAEFLGDQMIKDKGLNCRFIISEKPQGTPVTDRAIPVAIFKAEPSVKTHYLRRWLHDSSLRDFDIRTILDWNYYIERLSSTIQKLITIPAAMQKVTNPVPRVRHPDWLFKRVAEKGDKSQQSRIEDVFGKAREKAAEMKLRSSIADTAVNDEDEEGHGGHNDDHDDGMDVDQASSSLIPMETSEKRPVDIEDMVANKDKKDISTRKAPKPVVQKRKNIVEDVDDLEKRLPDQPPDPQVDYPDWLEYMKLKWKIQRLTKKRARMAGHGVAPARGPTPRIGNFFEKQSHNLLHSAWEILQIAPTPIPGRFTLWAMVEKNLHRVTLTVPRILYVNSRVEPEGTNVRKIQRTLPRHQRVLNLYEITMDEQDYVTKTKETSEDIFANANVAGVYERQVPLLFRAIMELGCVCAVQRKHSRNDTEFMLDELAFRQTSDFPYLQQVSLKYIFISHSFTDQRHVFVLYWPNMARARAFMVDTQSNPELTNKNMGRLYGEVLTERRKRPETLGSNELFSYSDNLDFDSQYPTSAINAYKLINTALDDYKRERRGPTVIIVQSPAPLAELILQLNEFPIVTMPPQKKDNVYPALGWQRSALRRSVQNYLTCNSFVAEQIQLARFAHVPIGNIEGDSRIFVCDLLMSRALRARNCVLWYSPSDRPDLGGQEQDDNNVVMDEMNNPEINVCGAYGTVSVELDLYSLAVNTVLESARINELEGSVGEAIHMTMEDHIVTGPSSGTSAFDDATTSGEAFKNVKLLLSSWTRESIQHRNPFADGLAMVFYRWIKSTSSKLYDPAVHRLIQGLMKKVFLQLLAEFKRLGATIVFANFNKIVINTSKVSMEHADAYFQYVLGAIKAKPLFQWLDINPIEYWDHLLWMDPANFAGIKSKPANDEKTATARVDMHWNIRSYLPPIMHHYFDVIVVDFILKVHEQIIKERSGLRARKDQNTFVVDGDTESTEFSHQLITSYFGQKLFNALPEMIRKLAAEKATNELQVQFPRLPGSHLSLSNPALEFSKHIIHVFQLDQRFKKEANVLRRNLLTLIGVREFSSEAVFHNPCLSFKLTEVICDYCNLCLDIDLCRDENLIQAEAGRWLCPSCRNEYNKGAIEESLIEILRQRTAAYQLQDLKCSKCRKIKVENMNEYCKCSGTYVNADSTSNINTLVKTFRNIAEFYTMPFLLEITRWIDER